MPEIPFQTIDWTMVESCNTPGQSGSVTTRLLQFHGFRMRMVGYSKGYLADHWCIKGHDIHCQERELVSEMYHGESF